MQTRALPAVIKANKQLKKPSSFLQGGCIFHPTSPVKILPA